MFVSNTLRLLDYFTRNSCFVSESVGDRFALIFYSPAVHEIVFPIYWDHFVVSFVSAKRSYLMSPEISVILFAISF